MIDTFLHFDISLLLSFIVAGLLLNITPGADFLLITASTINSGPKVGFAAAIGINLGVLVHIVMAAAGFSALLLAYPAAYSGLLYVGAAYLLFMAYRAWQADAVLGRGVAALMHSVAIKRGFLTNVLNPKTGLFIFAFLPQFTNPEYGPLWQQILILGFIFLINGFVFVLLLVTAASVLAPLLRKNLPLLNKLTAVMFCLLAGRLLFGL